MSGDGKKKSSPKKPASKLGHDPLAWIDEVDDKQAISEQDPIVAPGQYTDYPVASLSEVTESPPVSKVDVDASVKISAGMESSRLNLPAYFGIAQSSAICEEMRNLLSSGCKAIEISGNDVESFDASALQLMIAFRNQASANDVSLVWSGRSQKIQEISDLLNVDI